MKKILFLILFFPYSFAYAQLFTDGRVSLRDEPNGKTELLSLEPGVYVGYRGTENEWTKVVIEGYVDDSALCDDTLRKGTTLYSFLHNVIGETRQDVKIGNKYRYVDSSGLRFISITGYVYHKDIREFTIEELMKREGVLFADSTPAKMVVYVLEEEHVLLNSIRTEYTLRRGNYKSEVNNWLIRTVKNSERWIYGEGEKLSIDLTFYPDFSRENAFTYSKKADLFEWKEGCDYLIAIQYGCCSIEDKIELSTFSKNETFIKCTNSVYRIDIPYTDNEYFFGFDINSRFEDTTGFVLGELYYSINQVENNKIIFKVKDKEKREQIPPFTPEIKFITAATNDNIREEHRYKELWAGSQRDRSDISEIRDIGIKIIFSNMETKAKKEVDLLIEDGKIKTKEIVLDF